MEGEILSVGIDVGTTTTQIVFSRLQIENTASRFAPPKVEIVGKQLVHQSAVHLTPYRSDTRIDGEAVRELVAQEFRAAGFAPQDTGTGAVIVTGEAARKENARQVSQQLSGFAGDFVAYTAGPDLEAVVAGKGSGAQAFSKRRGAVVANLDIGGGTTNIAVFDHGAVLAKGSLDIGGRLVRVEQGTVASVSPAAQLVAGDIGVHLAPGQPADLQVLERIAGRMNAVLEEALGLAPKTPLADALATAGSTPIKLTKPVEYACFSGGVADCMQYTGPDPTPYGDIGVLLGRAVVRGALTSRLRPAGAEQTIRATVIGAGSCTMTVSGSTITYDRDVLPAKNLPVLTLTREEERALAGGDGNVLLERIRWFLEQSGADNLLLCLSGEKSPSYSRIQTLARGIACGAGALPPGAPVFAAVGTDTAKALGQQIDSVLGGARPVVCVDGVAAAKGDYVDLGAPLAGGLAVPVVVKTLIFS